ncbi:unnamed protein product [Ectocarpus sp. CCAP 1310/34]|nr:unnamed protein product [Ectocarpus sp. CCAP 1310/34]
MGAIRQELRSHSLTMWAVWDGAALLAPPLGKILARLPAPKSWRNIWAKGGSLVSFQILPRFGGKIWTP